MRSNTSGSMMRLSWGPEKCGGMVSLIPTIPTPVPTWCWMWPSWCGSLFQSEPRSSPPPTHPLHRDWLSESVPEVTLQVQVGKQLKDAFWMQMQDSVSGTKLLAKDVTKV